MNIIEYHNFFSEEDFTKIGDLTLRANGWGFGHRSCGNGLSFWNLPLNDNKFFTEYLFNKLQEKVGIKFDLVRVYANGQTYGLSGSAHKDDERDGAKTFLVYVNPIWDVHWAGNTVFYDDKEAVQSVPMPNKAILFDSAITHFGLEPSRHCNELRVTVAYKLMQRN
jgi:hypothetical protein